MTQIYTTIETFDANGTPVGVEIIDTVTDIDAFKAQARAAIDARFSELANVDPSVDHVRRLKLDEALEVAALDADRVEIDVAKFPLLKASLGPGEAPISGASRIIAAFRASRHDLARLEAIRIKAKGAIDKAKTAADVVAARDGVDWTRS